MPRDALFGSLVVRLNTLLIDGIKSQCSSHGLVFTSVRLLESIISKLIIQFNKIFDVPALKPPLVAITTAGAAVQTLAAEVTKSASTTTEAQNQIHH